MKVVISSNYEYKDIVTVPDVVTLITSIKKNSINIKEIECLVLTNSILSADAKNKSDSELSAVRLVSMLLSAINKIAKECRFFYISKEPIPEIEIMLRGVQAKVIQDEYYLGDEEELLYLLNTNEDTALSVTVTDSYFNLLQDFMTAVAANDSRIRMPSYIKVVGDAINCLEEHVTELTTQIAEISDTAQTFMSKILNMCNQYELQLKNAKSRMEELSKMASAPTQRRAMLGGGIEFYPTVDFQLSATKKMLVIKEYTPCKYLTSFLIGYTKYLETVKHIQVKLVFLVPKGKGILDRYNDSLFTIVNEESQQRSELFKNSKLVTNIIESEKIGEIIRAKDSYTVYIIVDRLMWTDKPFIRGNNIKTLNAVSGYSTLKKYNLSVGSTIFSHNEVSGEFLHIPTIKDYPLPTVIDGRYAKYAALCSKSIDNNPSLYSKLDNYIGVKGDFE